MEAPVPAGLPPLAIPAPASAFAQNSPADQTSPGVKTAEQVGAYVTTPAGNSPMVVATAGRNAYESDDWRLDDMPPPPDNFPAGWETEWQPSFENAVLAARPEPRPDDKPIAWPPVNPEKAVELEPPVVERPAETRREMSPASTSEPNLARPQIAPAKFEPAALPSLYVPLVKEDKDKDHPPKQITVMMRSMGDKDRDKLRIKTLYGTLISFHGNDRFSFQIFESGKGHLIDFPNDTTRICPEMLARLQKLVGEESWRVEEITFQ
jgi:hypothetical protein